MGIAFDSKEAHSAVYDAERTADLFCLIVNRWQALGGWPLAVSTDDLDNNADGDEENAEGDGE
jgi:ribonuclease T